MDLGSVALTGIVSAVIGLSLSGLTTFALLPRIRRAVKDGFLEGMEEKVEEIQKEPEPTLEVLIPLVANVLANLDPKLLTKALKPVADMLIAEFTGGAVGGKAKSLNIAGFKVPPEVYMPLLMKFAGGAANGAQNQALSVAESLITG